MSIRPLPRTLAWVLLSTSLLWGCASDPATPSSSARPGAADGSGDITVFAAASLAEPFTAIGARFESEHPGTTVTFSFAGSSGLAAQIVNGAPADVFAPASTATMDQVMASGATSAGEPVTFARNTIAIAVPPGNPGAVTSLADLADAACTVALCQEQVPCGTAASQVLDEAGLNVSPVTLEPDVKAVLTKVRMGEVDAGLVYVSDLVAAGADVTGIAIPEAVNAWTTYPIAVLTDGPEAATAAAFVAEVRSRHGQAVLEEAGFRPADPPGAP